MKKRRRRWIGKLIALLLVAAAAYGGFRYFEWSQADDEAESVLEVMMQLVPGLGVESSESRGLGKDPLPALSIQGIDIVGCLEIPALNIMAPVTAEGYEREYFATQIAGSPVQGQFRLIGGRLDVFRKIAKLNPGDRVVFTDIDGVRYEYQVTTQYHLKDWAEGDNDLLLCYETDDNTVFVVGCTTYYEE